MAFDSTDPAHEPLEVWAARRDDRRPKIGELRAVSLAEGPARGGHVRPDEPRCIERWDGFVWDPVTIVPDYAAARLLLAPTAPAGAVVVPSYNPLPLRAGRGRHRRT